MSSTFEQHSPPHTHHTTSPTKDATQTPIIVRWAATLAPSLNPSLPLADQLLEGTVAEQLVDKFLTKRRHGSQQDAGPYARYASAAR
eukprot:CAMPEP_0206243910 /NCGR_PEP_ID=MMETSP0047_2-20121206/17859_1 /ASSEMBLY_ACC=CAM_ASM_000192 /TAXON_ID=195065 /ORGANISM="Chroomonas mesostigmatica_cf, Strain CCMP1168" /LENGTH=86 /DNA_ID=CAMNT_0053669061 /DNA_START=67 /DNA_END=323 /DNA_ORIENTATION=-